MTPFAALVGGGLGIRKIAQTWLSKGSKGNKDKEEEGQERLNLDKMKAMMNDQQHDEKLEQNEELAELRAGVSLTKQQMADQSKRHDFGRNFKKN